ncbi:MAG: GNAT family N-acetyltransferase [Rhodobacterales bacterium]|jgi:RimJ/RimL family protein N-acetyltransferase|nr:GNAT family N-acetyltransferase [Rhodobacterales bacterium]MDX5388895.1 GNAT family N-acetyltransferase [Rhodobacterales bacterium]MDX5488584.1 GNAT family N-acetyltransferase [Rhodobacterales bacterium]
MKIDPIYAQPVIDTERFDLRPLRLSDKGLIEMYGADRRVAMNTRSIPHPLPPGAIEAFVKRAMDPNRTEDVWAMDGSRHGGPEVMGLISLAPMDRNQSEVSYWVAPAYWNSGVASAAVAALVAANPRACRTMFAEVFQDNPASARVLTNCGFEYLGDAETFSVARGAKVATWTYSRKLD